LDEPIHQTKINFMTTAFSFPRLLQLVRKQWFENSRFYLFSVLALLGLLALVFTFMILTGGTYFREESMYMIYLFGLYISGSVFASMSFNILGDKTKGTYWLSFPASHLEKLICVLFYTVIAFTLMYSACFYIVRSAAIAYIQSNPQLKFQPVQWSFGFMQAFPYFLYGYFAVQSFYLLGSAYFSRYAFIITTIVGAALIFAFLYYMDKLSDNSFGNGYNWRGDHVSSFNNGDNTLKRYNLSPFLTDSLRFMIRFIWAPVFWLVTFFRLKEKEL
jgi:hypothetical protein